MMANENATIRTIANGAHKVEMRHAKVSGAYVLQMRVDGGSWVTVNHNKHDALKELKKGGTLAQFKSAMGMA
jgi:Mlc titration factor MtfA (ptsG expression regulator)